MMPFAAIPMAGALPPLPPPAAAPPRPPARWVTPSGDRATVAPDASPGPHWPQVCEKLAGVPCPRMGTPAQQLIMSEAGCIDESGADAGPFSGIELGDSDVASRQVMAAKDTAWQAKTSSAQMAAHFSPQWFDARCDHGGIRARVIDLTCAVVNRLEPAGDLFSDDGGSEVGLCSTTSGASSALAGDSDAAASGFVGSDLTSPAVSEAEACNSSHARVIAIPVVTLEQMRERLAENDRRLRGSPRDSRTTVMLQRISYDLNEDGVRCILDQRGLTDSYDAVYVPRNAKKNVNLGYGFVNFLDSSKAAACIELCSGRLFGEGMPPRMCSADYAKNQGCMHMAKCEAAMLEKKHRRVAFVGNSYAGT